MSIFQHYTGGSYYRDDELKKIENPNWASSQAQYDQYYRDVTQKAENRAAAEKAALQAILTGKVSGDSGSDVRLSGMAGFAGNAGFGGMAGKAGMAGKSGGIASLVRGYEQGGEVVPKPNIQGFLKRSNTVNQPETTEHLGGGFLMGRKMFKMVKPIQKAEDLVPPEEQDEPTPPVDFRPYLISDLGRSFLDLNTFEYMDKEDDYMDDPIVRNYNQGGTVTPGDPLAARGVYIDLPKKEEKPKPKTGGPTPFIPKKRGQVEARSGGIETLIGALFGPKNQPTNANLSQEELDQRLLEKSEYKPLTESEKQDIIDEGNRLLKRRWGALRKYSNELGRFLTNEEYHDRRINNAENKRKSDILAPLKKEIAENQELKQGRFSNTLSSKQQLFNRQNPSYDLVKTTSAAVDTSKIPMPDFSEDRKAYEDLILKDDKNYLAGYQGQVDRLKDVTMHPDIKEDYLNRYRQTYIKSREDILKGMSDSGFKTGIPYFDLIAPTEQHVGTKTYNPYTGEYVENPHLSGIPSLVNRGVVRNKIF